MGGTATSRDPVGWRNRLAHAGAERNGDADFPRGGMDLERRPRLPVTGALDVLSDAVAIFDRCGTWCGGNREMLRLLDRSAGADQLRLEMQRLARAAQERTRAPGGAAPEEEAGHEIRLREERYLLMASLLEGDSLGEGGGVLVVLRSCRAAPMSAQCLRDRFGLSRQESRVAQLLVEGRTNGEVARCLCISPHTARHHTERILTKLNLHSRAAVAAKLLFD